MHNDQINDPVQIDSSYLVTVYGILRQQKSIIMGCITVYYCSYVTGHHYCFVFFEYFEICSNLKL